MNDHVSDGKAAKVGDARLFRAIAGLSSFTANEVAEMAGCSVARVLEFLNAYAARFEREDPEESDEEEHSAWRVRPGAELPIEAVPSHTQAGQNRLDPKERIELALNALADTIQPLDDARRAREVLTARRYLLAAETQLWDRQAATMSVSLVDQMEILSLRKRLKEFEPPKRYTGEAMLNGVERQLYDALFDWTQPMPSFDAAHEFLREELSVERLLAGDYGILRGVPSAIPDDLRAHLRPALRALALAHYSGVVQGIEPRTRREVLQMCRHVLQLPQPGLCIAPIAVLSAAWDAAEMAQPLLQVMLDPHLDQYLDAAARSLCLAAFARLAVGRAPRRERSSAAAASFYLATSSHTTTRDLALLGVSALLAESANRVTLLVRLARQFFETEDTAASFRVLNNESMVMRNLSCALFAVQDADSAGREVDAALLEHPAVEVLFATMVSSEHKAASVGDTADPNELFLEPHWGVVQPGSVKRVPLLRAGVTRSLSDQKLKQMRGRFQDLLTRQRYERKGAFLPASEPSNFTSWLSKREVDSSFEVREEAAA